MFKSIISILLPQSNYLCHKSAKPRKKFQRSNSVYYFTGPYGYSHPFLGCKTYDLSCIHLQKLSTLSMRVLSIMPKIQEISLSSQVKRSVSFPTPEYSSRNIPTEICRSIFTNRFISRLLFTQVGNSEKEITANVTNHSFRLAGLFGKCAMGIPTGLLAANLA